MCGTEREYQGNALESQVFRTPSAIEPWSRICSKLDMDNRD